MKNTRMKWVLLVTFLMMNVMVLYGQEKIQNITLKKGEVFDILLLSQYDGADEKFKNYAKTAFPVAQKMSYKPLPGFKIVELSQGNHRPEILVLGKWSSMEERLSFINEITDYVPDFHEQRKDIWSYFGLQYFEMPKDKELSINRGKYHVATSYWLDNSEKSSGFYKSWKKQVEKMGGEILIELKEGESPFGYQYKSDYFIITIWVNEASFTAFKKSILKVDLDNIQHINEYILQ